MTRIIAMGFAVLLLVGVGAGAASAATPNQRIAKLEKSVKALQGTVKKQQKTIKKLQNEADVALILPFCVAAVSVDALQSTWVTIDSALATPVFGAQQTISDQNTCSAFNITRQGIRKPPTTAAFSALFALLSSRETALFRSHALR